MVKSGENKRITAIRRMISGFPKTAGLYFMKDSSGKVLYIGKAKDLRSRVLSYFQPGANLEISRGPKISEMVEKVERVDFLETKSEVDAILQEARLIKDIRPAYNTDLVDDKTFPYLEITIREDFPGVYITRKPHQSGTTLFGPFTNVKELRQVLVLLQKIFRFRTCTLGISQNDDRRRYFRPCILYSIKQCTAPCADRIGKAEYKTVIRDLLKFLRSKRSVVIRELKTKMETAAGNREYETAAIYRDRVNLIERLDRRGTPGDNVQPEVFSIDPTKALQQLQGIIKSDNPIRIVEGIDIAHIGGTESVGSLVKFIDGKPFKAGYRRFKIKTVAGIDDYACIAEVVRRRYKYAIKGEELWPDVIVIDGGLGQLAATKKAMEELKAPAIRIISLAKKEESIYTLESSEPIRLGPTSPARKLLQYVRDEAHRFAQHYHHILRDKKLISH